MKQIIETIIPNRKAALIAAMTAVLLLCVSVAIPFTAAAFGRGFLPEETQVTEPTERVAAVDAQQYAQALAACEVMELELQQKEEQLHTLQEELQISREALALSEEQVAQLQQQIAECEAEIEELQALVELIVSSYSRKYMLEVKVSGKFYGFVTLEWSDKAYVTEEEFHRYQIGDVLSGHSDVGVPSVGAWTVTIVSKIPIELEGIA